MLGRFSSSRSLLLAGASTRSRFLSSSFSSLNNNSNINNGGDVAVGREELPRQKRVVIIGGGVIGCSTAYNLAKLGLTDVLLLEQDKLTSGTTWHAAGLIGAARSTEAETRLSVEGIRVVQEVEKETGLSAGYKQDGSITVARSPERMTALHRIADRVRAFGLDAEMISPEECGRRYNGLMKTDDLEGGLWLPQDGSGSPTDLTNCYAKGARDAGVEIRENVRVGSINVVTDAAGRKTVRGVTTECGSTIDAETVVLCAGQWSKQIGASVGVNVPLHSAEHYYVITEPIEGVTPDLPVMRDLDAYIYFREWSGGLCMGGFEPVAKPIFEGYDAVPRDFAFSLLPDDYEQFDILYTGSMERVPAMETAGVSTFLNGPESFTTDGHYLLGEAPEVGKLFVCAGMNSSGIASSGGAGMATAEWIVNGEPTMDLGPVDIRRHHRSSTMSPLLLKDRIAETLGLHYTMPWPRKELKTARGLRKSPIYRDLEEAGAVFGQRSGWERANYFAGGNEIESGTFGHPAYTPQVSAEVKACRESAAIFDQTSFSKYDVVGRDAVSVMQRLCCANVDVPVGKIVYTGMLNGRGGYEADVTVTRKSEAEFSVVSATSQSTRDIHWMNSNIADDEFCVVRDVTSAYAVLSVMGPRSRCILSSCSYASFSDEDFPFGTAQDIDIGYGVVNARRVTYMGELGWELHVPAEFASGVYDTLAAACRDVLGIERAPIAGYFAIDALRLEKGYRAYGHELGPEETPIEAGLSFTLGGKAFGTAACNLGDFIGRDALLRQGDVKASGGLDKRLVSFEVAAGLEELPTIPWGGEPIYFDGNIVGKATTSGIGHYVGKALAMGYVKHPDVYSKGFLKSGKWEVNLAGKRMPIKASLRPAYDPKSARLAYVH